MSDTGFGARLFVEFEMAEGAMVRMLGLVERRGFRVCRVAMGEQPCGRRGSLSLTVAPRDSARRTDVLVRQLERLHDVLRVAQEPAFEQAA